MKRKDKSLFSFVLSFALFHCYKFNDGTHNLYYQLDAFNIALLNTMVEARHVIIFFS